MNTMISMSIVGLRPDLLGKSWNLPLLPKHPEWQLQTDTSGCTTEIDIRNRQHLETEGFSDDLLTFHMGSESISKCGGSLWWEFVQWSIFCRSSQNIFRGLKFPNGNVFMLMRFSSLVALEVVILTTYNAACDENFICMMIFPYQWTYFVSNVKTFFRALLLTFITCREIFKQKYWKRVIDEINVTHQANVQCFSATQYYFCNYWISIKHDIFFQRKAFKYVCWLLVVLVFPEGKYLIRNWDLNSSCS